MRAAQAKADALRDRDMLAEALRSAEAVEDRLRASEAALGARCLQEKSERHKADMKLEEVTKGADDALTVAATQQRERDAKLRELDALSARLAQELATRVGELVAVDHVGARDARVSEAFPDHAHLLPLNLCDVGHGGNI